VPQAFLSGRHGARGAVHIVAASFRHNEFSHGNEEHGQHGRRQNAVHHFGRAASTPQFWAGDTAGAFNQVNAQMETERHQIEALLNAGVERIRLREAAAIQSGVSIEDRLIDAMEKSMEKTS
jgi:hypothetical protein